MSARVDGAQIFVDMFGTSSNSYGGNANDYYSSKSLFDIVRSASGETGTSDDSLADLILKAIKEWFNSRGSAEKDVAANNKRIIDAQDSAIKEKDKAEESIAKIITNISGNIDSINKALENIQKLSGNDKGNYQYLAEQLEEEKKIITQNIEILRNGDEKDKPAALQAIKDCNARIEGLLTNVKDIEQKINDLNSEVAAQTSNVETQQTSAANLIADTLGIVENIKNQTQKEATAQIEATAAEGALNKVQGEEVLAVAEGTTVVTEGMAAGATATIKTNSIEQIGAGAIRIKGSAESLINLKDTIALIGDAANYISDFTTTIGSYSDNAADLIGSYNSQAQSMITSIGSWSTVQSTNALLCNAIKEYDEGKQDSLLAFKVENFGKFVED